MKKFILIGLVCVAPPLRAETVVAPNGLENVEGNSSAGPLFGGGSESRTQIIYSSSHFSLFPPEGAYITELRFRMDGQYPSGISGIADLALHLSTSSSLADSLFSNMARNVGADDIEALPRTTVSITESKTSLNGPNSFSVVIPLPNKFYYNPANGNLLVDATVYSGANIVNLDWELRDGDGVSTAVRSLDPRAIETTISTTAPVTQFVFEPVPKPRAIASLMLGPGLIEGRKVV